MAYRATDASLHDSYLFIQDDVEPGTFLDWIKMPSTKTIFSAYSAYAKERHGKITILLSKTCGID